jgi:hypothetical protein
MAANPSGDIATGRAQLGQLDQLRQDWRKAGGDQIRTELEKAYAASKA